MLVFYSGFTIVRILLSHMVKLWASGSYQPIQSASTRISNTVEFVLGQAVHSLVIDKYPKT